MESYPVEAMALKSPVAGMALGPYLPRGLQGQFRGSRNQATVEQQDKFLETQMTILRRAVFHRT